MMDWLRSLRSFCLILVSGAAVGGYAVHNVEASPLIRIAVSGACAQQGIQTVVVSLVLWYNCQDTIIANGIQTSDALNAARDLKADPIGEIIRANEHSKRTGKKR